MINLLKCKSELNKLQQESDIINRKLSNYENKEHYQVKLLSDFWGLITSENNVFSTDLDDKITCELNNMSTEQLKLLATEILSSSMLIIRRLSNYHIIYEGESNMNITINHLIINLISDDIHNLPHYLNISEREGLIREIPHFFIGVNKK